MPRKKTKSPEDEKYDKIAKHLFKGTLAQTRKKLRSHIFEEWLKLHPEIVEGALTPPASNEIDILRIITNTILEKQKMTLKDLLQAIKPRTTIKTQKELKKLIAKLEFPKNYKLVSPKRIIGSSLLQLEKEEISEDQFLFQLRQAYETAPMKMGNMIEIPVLADIVSKTTGWRTEIIYQHIYKAYLEKEVDLQPGKTEKGNYLLAEDGSKFYWFQFR